MTRAESRLVMAQAADFATLRATFERMLTKDGSRDRRRRDYNVAIFNADEGWAVWNRTDLYVVLEAFDHAVRAIKDGRA